MGSITGHPAQASSGLCKINTVGNTWPHRARPLLASDLRGSPGPHLTKFNAWGHIRPGQRQTSGDQGESEPPGRLEGPSLCYGATSRSPAPIRIPDALLQGGRRRGWKAESKLPRCRHLEQQFKLMRQMESLEWTKDVLLFFLSRGW